MKPVVALVGRANVGKSTLFNRLTGTRLAIVEDEPGVTRDRLYRDVTWRDQQFTLIDTGGLEPYMKDEILSNVREQVDLAIHEADLIIFMVDVRTGITEADQEIGQRLRKSGKDVIVCVNKLENFDDQSGVWEFYDLGFGDVIPISATHGTNTGDLLDVVFEHLQKLPDAVTEEEDILSIAVVGRPNVGKSSLTNALIGEQRSIVSSVAGTTRDAIDSTFKWHGEKFRIIDTAGMRRKRSVLENTERYSVMRSLSAIERSDVVLMVLNAVEGLQEQDKKIVGYAHEAGKGIILVVNKWDLVEKDQHTQRAFENKIKNELLFLSYAPVLFVSAETHQRLGQIMEKVSEVAETRNLRLKSSILNEIIRDAVRRTPLTEKGKHLKVYYATQVAVAPPTFVFFVNDKELMHFSYLRYLENQIREHFIFEGTRLVLHVRERKANEL